jgi:hypothetical protein
MRRSKKQTGRYVVEVNDWGCGLMIKDTLTGKEIDAPDGETITLCIEEMNRLAVEVEKLTNCKSDADRFKAEAERLFEENKRLTAIGDKMREMVGDHHWTLVWDRETNFRGNKR